MLSFLTITHTFGLELHNNLSLYLNSTRADSCSLATYIVRDVDPFSLCRQIDRFMLHWSTQKQPMTIKKPASRTQKGHEKPARKYNHQGSYNC